MSPDGNGTYRGSRDYRSIRVHKFDQDGRRRALNPRTDLRNHSPDGFNWGYGGSGPAQLALAIMCDALADDGRAQACYQDFKWQVIAKLPHASWEMSRQYVLDWYGHWETDELEADAP